MATTGRESAIASRMLIGSASASLGRHIAPARGHQLEHVAARAQQARRRAGGEPLEPLALRALAGHVAADGRVLPARGRTASMNRSTRFSGRRPATQTTAKPSRGSSGDGSTACTSRSNTPFGTTSMRAAG